MGLRWPLSRGSQFMLHFYLGWRRNHICDKAGGFLGNILHGHGVYEGNHICEHYRAKLHWCVYRLKKLMVLIGNSIHCLCVMIYLQLWDQWQLEITHGILSRKYEKGFFHFPLMTRVPGREKAIMKKWEHQKLSRKVEALEGKIKFYWKVKVVTVVKSIGHVFNIHQD